MTKFCTSLALGSILMTAVSLSAADKSDKKTPLTGEVKTIDGKTVDLKEYQDKVVLVVNTASYCGNTPQYEALQELHEKYADKGLAVLGFPANEFGAQEPGTDAEIAEFCTKEYGVTFPMFSKIVVKGEGQAPLYKHLTSKETNPEFAGPISWNFEKFLISRNGEVVGRFKPGLSPKDDAVVNAIERELAKK